MSFNHPTGPSSTLPESDQVVAAYANSIVGAAIFDLNGLPKEYFMTGESNNMGWVQTIFQALGLRSLLISSLQLEGFHHAVIHGAGCCAVVVKQPARYLALLVRQTEPTAITDTFIQWVQAFEPSALKANSKFHVA